MSVDGIGAGEARSRLRRINLPLSLIIGSTIVVAWLLVAGFGPFLSPYDPNAPDVARALLPPGAANWLGTDSFGRDVLTRLMYGGKNRPSDGVLRRGRTVHHRHDRRPACRQFWRPP